MSTTHPNAAAAMAQSEWRIGRWHEDEVKVVERNLRGHHPTVGREIASVPAGDAALEGLATAALVGNAQMMHLLLQTIARGHAGTIGAIRAAAHEALAKIDGDTRRLLDETKDAREAAAAYHAERRAR